MAESIITRNALAQALQDLMDEKPFERISVTDICERCGMNRKSFYYHFRDKYDLVNWIFDRDFIKLIRSDLEDVSVSDQLKSIRVFCDYLYENRRFYGKVLKMKGQNSLAEHLQEIGRPIVRQRIYHIAGEDYADDFTVEIVSDACILAVEKWLLQKDPMTPDELIGKMTDVIWRSTGRIYHEMELEQH